MPDSANVHVVPHHDGWAVKRANGTRASFVYPRQVDAFATAQNLARRDRVELVIHNEGGGIRMRFNYGYDPSP